MHRSRPEPPRNLINTFKKSRAKSAETYCLLREHYFVIVLVDEHSEIILARGAHLVYQ